MKTVSSSGNPLIKHITSLKQKKYRYEFNQYIIEGAKSIREATKYGVKLDYILIAREQLELMHEFKEYPGDVVLVENNIFKKLSEEKNPQGIMAVARFYSHSLDDIAENGKAFLVLDRIQDPGNMGTLIRSADAFGVDGILLSSGCCDVYSPKVVRATMGSIFHIPFVYEDMDSIMNAMSKNDVFVIGTSPHAAEVIKDADIRLPAAVVLGNESVGMDDNILLKCDGKVKIDMKGRAESLNVAVAGSIIMYEIFKTM